MNQEELTKTFMMILNLNKPFGVRDLYKINSALYGLTLRAPMATMVLFIWFYSHVCNRFLKKKNVLNLIFFKSE